MIEADPATVALAGLIVIDIIVTVAVGIWVVGVIERHWRLHYIILEANRFAAEHRSRPRPAPPRGDGRGELLTEPIVTKRRPDPNGKAPLPDAAPHAVRQGYGR